MQQAGPGHGHLWEISSVLHQDLFVFIWERDGQQMGSTLGLASLSHVHLVAHEVTFNIPLARELLCTDKKQNLLV
jgi:hypothetical protein